MAAIFGLCRGPRFHGSGSMLSAVMVSRFGQAVFGVICGIIAFGVAWNPTYHRFFERLMTFNFSQSGTKNVRLYAFVWRALIVLPVGALSFLTIVGAVVGKGG